MTDREAPAAVLFDWDNTLVDSWPVIHDALNTTFRAFGLEEWSLEETRAKVRHSMRDSFPGLFGDEWQNAADVFYARYAAIHVEAIVPAKGAEQLLSQLHNGGTYLGVVSNKTGSFLRAEADHLGWSKYFGKIVGAMDAERDKPDPAPIDMALAPSGLNKGPNVWFVGDADIDMTCGMNAGCLPILIRPNAPEPDEIWEHPPSLHFETCVHLGNFLRTM